ncbi:UNC93-like protein 2 [Linum perenne]
MIRALSGMGGGGQRDPTAANNANTAIYATFAISGVLSGGLFNVLGPRLMLPAGCMACVLLAGSFLNYNHTQNEAFMVVSGVIAGVGAGFLWGVQGAIMTSYPPPHRKGMYISLFWVIFSSGGVVGGLIPFFLNFHRQLDSVNDATYIAFMCFMAAGNYLPTYPPQFI